MFLQIIIFFSLSSIFFSKIYIYIFFLKKISYSNDDTNFVSPYRNEIIQNNFSKIIKCKFTPGFFLSYSKIFSFSYFFKRFSLILLSLFT